MNVGFGVLTAMPLKGTSCKDMMTCKLVEVYQSFGEMYCFHHQGLRFKENNQVGKQQYVL
jgi:hypothetical protein